MGALAVFCSGPGQSYAFSVFVDPILSDIDISRTQLSALYGVGTGVSALMVAIVGRLVDRFGARVMLTVIALALGVACFGMSLAAGSVGLLLGFAALRALGQGSLPVTGTLLTVQWFTQKRGRAMAIVGLGGAISNALIPPFARFLIETVGWRGAYRGLGIMVWLLLIPAVLFVVRNRPEDIGLHPDGAPSAQELPSPGRTSGRRSSDRRVFTSLNFWLLALPLTAVPFVVTALIFHQASILNERGLGPAVSAAVFLPLAIAVAGGSTLGGFLVERSGPRWALLLTQALLLLAVVELWFVSSPLTAVLYALTVGASAGMTQVTGGVTWAHYYGREGLGRVQGSASMVMISAAALAPLPVAALQQVAGSYGPSLALMAALPVLCAALLVLSRPKSEKPAAAG